MTTGDRRPGEPAAPPAGQVVAAFGLDLAGYSTDGSALAGAERLADGEVRITVVRNHCFGRKVAGKRLLQGVARSEVALLAACLRRANVVVDVPIDLQGLPSPCNPRFVWELTKRPVDYAFSAMPPLAQRIGSYVGRFGHLRRSLPAGLQGCLGASLFETYPAASLALLKIPNKKYKGIAACKADGTWQGRPDDGAAQSAMNRRLSEILNALGWKGQPADVISHDEFDASLCAVTGLANPADRLDGESLKEHIERAVKGKCQPRSGRTATDALHTSPPAGYRLLNCVPAKAVIRFWTPKDDEDLLRIVSSAESIHGLPAARP